ncbi:hypothetical protein B0H11DRAFT_1936281 [Mycena galericulata]|nr:hypothetical protein B0H11DRAFT_1936281 [Mycena galericulata]
MDVTRLPKHLLTIVKKERDNSEKPQEKGPLELFPGRTSGIGVCNGEQRESHFLAETDLGRDLSTGDYDSAGECERGYRDEYRGVRALNNTGWKAHHAPCASRLRRAILSYTFGSRANHNGACNPKINRKRVRRINSAEAESATPVPEGPAGRVVILRGPVEVREPSIGRGEGRYCTLVPLHQDNPGAPAFLGGNGVMLPTCLPLHSDASGTHSRTGDTEIENFIQPFACIREKFCAGT